MKTCKVPLIVAGFVLMTPIIVRGQAKVSAWNYPMSYDSVKAAPNSHKLLYEDTKLRFIEVTIRPGEQEPMNGQPYPSVYMHDRPMPDTAQIVEIKLDPNSALNGQGAGHGSAPPGVEFPTCDTMPPVAPHQITNHSASPIHYYSLEFKRLDGADLGANWKVWYPWMVPPIPVFKNLDATNLGPPFSKEWPYPIALDSVTAAPNNHKALYADEHVRVVEVTERPESQENLHGHPYRSIFVNDIAPPGPPPNAAARNTAAAAPNNAPAGRTPLGRPGPYHKGEVGDYQSDQHAIPWLRGATGRPPAGMIAPSCTSAMAQAPHAHINGGEVPGHFYRVEFLRADWQEKYAKK
jgi:hypothetical protein